MTKTHTGDFAAGENGTYNLTVSNTGPSSAEADITVTDTLPAGLTFVSGGGSGGFTCTAVGQTVTCVRATSLTPGASASFDVTVAVSPSAGPEVTNTASTSSDTDDPDPGNNSDSDPTVIVTSADVALAKEDSADPVTPGSDFSYVLSVTNNGPADASAVSVTDELPEGTSFVSASGLGWTCDQASGTVTCTRDSLAEGASAPDITITVTAPSAAGRITNSASVSAAEDDPSLGNNSATEDTTVQAAPGPLPMTGEAIGLFLLVGSALVAAGSLTHHGSRKIKNRVERQAG
jgi:uncharacterized repeat protein (TIGR01451 family)